MMMLTSMMMLSSAGCLVVGLGTGLWWERRRTRARRALSLAWLPQWHRAVAIPVQRTASPPVATRPKAVPRAG